jgi:decaprenylphospho-beta-D-erythro-pentofuranosid-2-ulose 2-reductase
VRDGLGDVQSVLLLGGTSDIGLAIARRLARPRQAAVVLAGRDKAALEEAAAQLGGSGGGTSVLGGAGKVTTVPFDALDTDSHDAVIEEAARLLGDLDVVIVAFGLLGDQAADEAGGEGAVRLASVNYVGAISVGLAAARRLRAQGHGTLVILSSVAGERVRQANYIYGSSKAGLDGFAQGLGDALQGSGASVLIVRPGFVATKMTTGMKPPPLSTTPEAVAAATEAALRQGREIVWVPGPLRGLMMVVRHLPRPIFRRLKM